MNSSAGAYRGHAIPPASGWKEKIAGCRWSYRQLAHLTPAGRPSRPPVPDAQRPILGVRRDTLDAIEMAMKISVAVHHPRRCIDRRSSHRLLPFRFAGN
jgi:hypothetical protein